MAFKYKLNVSVYEVGVVLINTRKTNGTLELDQVLERYSSEIGPTVYKMYKFGIDLILKGYDPQMSTFVMTEYLDQLKLEVTDSYELMKDLRLVAQFVKWLQTEAYEDHLDYIRILIKDESIRSQYINWALINEKDLSFKFSEFRLLTWDDIQKRINS